MSSTPKWRKVFDRVERVVGAPLEDVAASNRFVEVVAVGMKVRRVAGGTARRAVGGVTGKLLWAVNAPSRDDIRRLNGQIATLASEVRALEQKQRPTSASAGGPAARRPRADRPSKPPAAPRKPDAPDA